MISSYWFVCFVQHEISVGHPIRYALYFEKYGNDESVYLFPWLKIFENFFHNTNFQSALTLYLDCKYFLKMNIIFKMQFLKTKIKPQEIE